MKRFFQYAIVAAVCPIAAIMISCSKDDNDSDKETHVTLNCQVTEVTNSLLGADIEDHSDSISSYGEVVLSVKTAELNKAGIEYSDVVDITVGDIEIPDVPFVTSFNEVPLYSPCLCDYNATGLSVSIGMGCGDFTQRYGGHLNDPVTITLKTKGGYAKTRELLNSQYYYEREKYDSDEMFANFRMVTTTGMKSKTLYRSGNPMNYIDNKERYRYVDSLAREAGIVTEIDLADTDAKIASYRDSLTNEGTTYCLGLYDAQQTIALGLTADAFSDKFMTRLADGLRFMATHDAPYLIHCNEGKDRCGFVSMLLEALAGATYKELVEDYMVTFYNLMRITSTSESYTIRKQFSIDRMIYLMGNLEDAQHPLVIDWNNIKPETIDLQTAARKYIISCGLTSEECDTLQAKLRKE